MYQKRISFTIIAFVLAFAILAIILILIYNGSNTIYAFEEELDGQNIHLNNNSAFNITFTRDEQGQDSTIFTDFTVTPGSGRIKVKFIDGNCDELLVNLYDTSYKTIIMTTKIAQGKTISFKHLLGNHNYYFEIIPDRDLSQTNEIGDIVLLISA